MIRMEKRNGRCRVRGSPVERARADRALNLSEVELGAFDCLSRVDDLDRRRLEIAEALLSLRKPMASTAELVARLFDCGVDGG